ncbi:MAG: DUF4139 domain-containing protein [Candidatus Goldbacteria bacterium]|nr:DUF4139 domain-containing protein [Candidatus Goldiibacteriota bacterium]
MKKYIFIIIMFLLSSILFSNGIENFIIIYKSKGFVTEKKKIDIKKGSNTVYFFNNDVGIIKNTIFIKLERDEIKNLSYKYIETYAPEEIIGKKIKVFIDSKILEGEVISNINELVLKTDNSIFRINREKITYLEYPVKDFSILTPGNLIINFDSDEQMASFIKFNYFTSSLSWSSAYNFIFNEDENELKMDLNVNIQNNGGKSYKNSKIYVVSGDVNTETMPQNYNRFLLKAAEISTTDEGQNISQQKLSDFYEYSIKGIYDIDARQNITVYILKNSKINFFKEYFYDSSFDSEGVRAKFIITNIKEDNLGMPLPAGEASLFIEKNGELHFIGKDMVKDTPEKEKIELKTGKIFDVKVDRKHLFTEKISNNVWEEKYSILFKNYKNNKIKIKVIEKINSVYWEIRESSHNYKKINNNTIEFEIEVEAQKSTEIIYKVRKRY